jgi:bifunctional non-homologous end joining protein LigD
LADSVALKQLTRNPVIEERFPGYTPDVTIKKAKANFIEPMLLLRSATLPEDDGWIREIKLDGYRTIAFKNAGKIQLRSRNDNDMAARYPAIAKALSKLPDDTIVDGELVALDEDDRPSFNLLQNYGNSSGPLLFFIFDLLMLSGRDLKEESLETRRALLEKKVISKLSDPIRLSPALEGSMKALIASVKQNRLEGLVQSGKTVSISQGCAQAYGGRCGSTWVRSLSSADTRRAPRTSTRWSLASMRERS